MMREKAEEIYRRGLIAVRDFCENRNFNVYCKSIVHDVNYVLKKGRQAEEESNEDPLDKP